MAETLPRGVDRHCRGSAGGWWRGTSQWRTICSTCSPAVGGRQYRVRGDAQVRLRNGLEAPMKLRPLARHRPPNSSLPELDAIFIIPSAAKRHKRLRRNQSVVPCSPPSDPRPLSRGRRRSTPVAPGVPAGWPYGAMPVLCLLSLISRNSPKQLGMVSPELPTNRNQAVRYGVPGTPRRQSG